MMKRLTAATAGLLMTGTLLTLGPQTPTAAQPPPVARQGIVVEPQTGRTLYQPPTATDYRTGPALTRLSATTIHQHTCGPVPSSPGEVIRHRASYDAGSTWAAEQLALQGSPSPSMDAAGVCDPAVVNVGGHYYLAYTGTSASGTKQVFVARSAAGPAGPFDKWNGTGWSGGNPAPLNTGATDASGPSLVVKDNALFLYYTVRITTGPAAGTYLTRLATATLGTTPTEQATWPNRLTPQTGNAIEHPGKYTGLDCVGNHWWADTDVKYDEVTGKFLAITTDQATVPWYALQAYESTDGLTFTKAIMTRGDYELGARSPGQLADVAGHLVAGAGTAIAYAHTTGCKFPFLRLNPTTQRSLITGAFEQPLWNGAAAWRPFSGQWSVFPDRYYQQTDATSGLLSATMLTGHAVGGSSTIQAAVRGTSYAAPGGWVGVSFNSIYPRYVPPLGSGYTAILVSPTQASGGAPRLCVLKGTIAVACRDLPGVTWNVWHTMTIVQSNGTIKVYLDGQNGLSVAYNDPDNLYLGGYVGLATRSATGTFVNLSAGDNVPGEDYTDADWSTSGGPWTFTGDTIESRHTGQANLQSNTGTPVQLGDGTYAADILMQLGEPSDWAGLALTNDGVTGSFGSGGYLVFLRQNGNLGIWKAGAGQVVPDTFTGNYLRDRIRLRVVKTGANFQVYVTGLRTPHTQPVLNWTDPNPPAWGIGGFGLAALNNYTVFDDVIYNANNARW